MKNQKKFGLFLWSEMKSAYAPTLHDPQDTAKEMADYARANLKLEQNLTGKAAFEVRPVYV